METLQNNTDLYLEHSFHNKYMSNCSDCFKERTEDKAKTDLIENNLSKIQEYFINLLEINGRPITKDNVEDMFDSWLENQSLQFLQKIINDK